jgi:two-component sensor histidine kinase
MRRGTVVIRGRYKNAQGEYRILQTDARPRLSPKGEFLGMLGVNIDVTDRERADAQRELLLAELNHRVKNTLAVVQGIAHQTFRSAADLRQARNAFEGRLVALAAAHNLLTRSNWENASIADIAADTLQPRAGNGDGVRLAGPEVLLAPKEAVAIAMALHELSTNALKYGALSNDSGSVELTWTVERERTPFVRFVWQERGGPPVNPPEHRGFGSLLLERTLAQDLRGSVDLEYRREGVRCTIEMPLSSAGGAA